MTKYPGFLLHLQEELENLPEDILSRVSRHGGLEISDMMSNILRPVDHDVCDPSDDVDVLAEATIDDIDLGKDLLKSQKIAVIVYGQEAIKSSEKITKSVGDVVMSISAKEGSTLRSFETFLLTPQHRLESPVDLVECGTGDAVAILKENDLIQNLRQRGVKHLYLTNLDEVNYHLIGTHDRRASTITCRVERSRSDSNVLLVNNQGIKQLVSKFRINLSDPAEDPVDKITWSWSGTSIINLSFDISAVNWRWHRRPVVKNGRVSYQFMRLFEDVTSTFKTEYVR